MGTKRNRRRIETKTSRTAQYTCICRAASFRERRECYKGSDDIAYNLGPGIIKLILRSSLLCQLCGKYLAPRGIYEYVIARTKYIDSEFCDALKKRFDQIVIFGAGFDSRAERFDHLNKSTKIFEPEVSPKLYIVHLSNHAQQGVDESFFQGFGVITANGIKILTQCGLGDDVSQVREGKTVAASDFMPTFGDVFQPCAIYPGNGSCHHREIDVIDHGMGITGLAFATTNVLFDLLETGFDFPPCTIVLDDLFNGQT